MKRILIVNANWLGDVLFSTPAIRAIRKKYPESFMACLAPARVKEVLIHNPHLNEVMIVDDRADFFSLWRTPRVAAQIRKGNFDTAIFFHRSKTKVWLTALAGIPERIGFETPGKKKMLTQTFAEPAKALHRIDHYLYLLQKAGIPSDGRHLEYNPAPETEEALWKRIGRNEPYVVLHVGGNWELKRWPAEYFVEWIRLWRKEFREKIILCGTDAEIEIVDRICSNFSKDEVLSLCGKTSFDELACLLKNAHFLLSNDSGPIHLAATQKTKVLGIFGPTSPDITGPVSEAPVKILWKDVGCEVPCYYRVCHYRVCMDWIKPEEVFKKTKELLQNEKCP